MRLFSKKPDFYSVLICVLAGALQIQLTLFASTHYQGLRVNLADFVLPVAGAWVLFSLLRGRTRWPEWIVPHMWLWLAGLAVLMSAALGWGYLNTGALSVWALVNKYTGFLILLAYMLLGGWIACNARTIDVRVLFLKVFSGFFIATLLLSAVLIVLRIFLPPIWIEDYPWDGLMANRNAFMVAAIFVLIMMESVREDVQFQMPRWIYPALWAMVPFLAVYNASRTGMIVGAVVMGVLLVWKPVLVLKRILPILAIGGLFAYTAYILAGFDQIRERRNSGAVISYLGGAEEDFQGDLYIGDQNRLLGVEDGLELYRQSNPILGAGLGGYRVFQEKKRGEFVDIIDFTGVWLLAETGLAGVTAFGGFFAVCLYALYRRGFGPAACGFSRGLAFFLLAFGFMSCLHELMYTRFLWFALGLGLAAVAGEAGKDGKMTIS